MKIPKSQYLYHIIGCVAFLLLPLILSPRPPEEVGNLFSIPTIRDIVANALMLLFFYINYYILIDQVYFKRKYLKYGVIVIIAFLLIISLPSLITGYHFWQSNDVPPIPRHEMEIGRAVPVKPSDSSFLQEVRHHIYLFSVVILFSILLQVNNRLLRTDKERIAAELAHLKAQIHPHFLFNTLNSIYALTIRKDDGAGDSIVKLSEFMRYLLKDANENEVMLEKELGYISNYMDLQVSRLRDSVKLTYDISGKPRGKRIAPLLLFSFIENAFKHGVNPDEDSEINISIYIEDQAIRLSVMNKVVTVTNKEYSTNIGIENTRERLNLFYPGKHQLEINSDREFFRVRLFIELA